MKRIITRILMAVALGGPGLFPMHAESVVSDGITYEIDAENGTATVISKEDGTAYSGKIVIARSVKSGEKDYTVTAIESRCFYNNQQVTSVTLPTTITEIGAYAFCACYGMTSINLQDTQVTELPTGAFGACWKLENITLPATLVKLTDNPFYMPTGLKSFAVAEENPVFKAIDGILYTKSGKTLVAYPFGKTLEVEIPEGTDSIGNEAFMNFRSMRKCTLPETVTYIGRSSFTMCDTLESINLPRTLKFIGGSAFHGNQKMAGKAVFDDGLTSLGASAFNSTAITEVEIPGTCRVVSKSAFYNCRQVTSIILHEGITRLMETAFLNCKATEIVIPNSVTTMNAQVFAGNTAAKTLVIGSGVTSFDSNPFGSCAALTSVTCLGSTPPSYLPVYETRYPLFPAAVYQNATLYVPDEAKNAYREAAGWKNFTNLISVGIEEVKRAEAMIERIPGGVRVSGHDVIEIYSANGLCVYKGNAGEISLPTGNLYIVKVGSEIRKLTL